MEFMISEKEIFRRKYIVPTIILLTLALYLILAIYIPTNKERPIIKIVFIVFVIALIVVFVNIYTTKQFIKFAKKHKLQITPKGLNFYNDKIWTLISWNEVKKIKLKGNKSTIKKLLLFTKSSELIILSKYNSLENLNSELHKYLDSDLWK